MKNQNFFHYFFIICLSTFTAVSQNTPPNPLSDSDKNWTSAIQYDLTGASIFQRVNYFNLLGKPSQSQSWDVLNNKIWASQTFYDSHGREALQTLSAPIGNNFGYNENDFILNSSGNFFTNSDFETNLNNPSQISSNGKLGNYYLNNTYTYQDQTYYPYIRTLYSNLDPGKAHKVLGLNKVNGEWLQSYRFSMPATQELSKPNAFNNNAYDKHDIFKTVNRDVNGFETIVFTDSEGKVLAAARSGDEENSNPTNYSVTSEISELGYVDIHIPVGCSGLSVSNLPNEVFLKIYDLETEEILISSSDSNINLDHGVYRVQIDSNVSDYVWNYSQNQIIRLTYDINYYDYSLNTYDKAGRLLKSTQPLSKDLESSFTYNSLGQLLETTSPDEGSAKFKYRKDGQIRFSQNSKQEVENEISFTKYDTQGRPIVSGVANIGQLPFEGLNPEDPIPPSFISNKELQLTTYDKLDGGIVLPGLSENYSFLDQYKPRFLYGNVAKTSTSSPETTTTWYSYDVYGRVEWVVQYINNLGLHTIDYTYDPVTGNTTKVDLNRHRPSHRFVHKYEYNEGGQLKKVSTSVDDTNYTENAEYFYNEDSSLRRTELGEDLQGIDYVYNINGQLKAINSPLNTGFTDPGNDNPLNNGFKPDVFGMIIDYHPDDFKRSASNLEGLANNSALYQLNGNISSLRWHNGQEAKSNFTDAFSFKYNKNNWLAKARFGTNTFENGNVTFEPSANQDYSVGIGSYDANGNIKTLFRNGYTDGAGSNDMDEFTYHYSSMTNQLSYIEDSNDNSDPLRYDDLRDQSIFQQDNYLYNNIGQLVTNLQDEIGYEYNSSGLVTSINNFTDENTGEWTYLFKEDFENATDEDAFSWFPGVNTNSLINYGQFITSYTESGDFIITPCHLLKENFGNNLMLTEKDLDPSSQVGDPHLNVSRTLKTISGKLHRLSLDIIAKQVDAEISEGFPALDNPIGYIVTIEDNSGNVIISNNYNTPNPEIISDSLEIGNPCTLYYEKNETLEFTPNTEQIKIRVDIDHDLSNKTIVHIDNINLEVASAPKIAFYYNDKGHRVRKEFYNNSTTYTTYYVRDVSGTVLSIYESEALSNPLVGSKNQPVLKENPVYGNSRIGLIKRGAENIQGGTYVYQLTDHLGNVRAVVMEDSKGIMSLINQTDYYPFGMPMPNRNVEGDYRYGYQGQEKDAETGKEAFELRLWDGRIGRWLSPDPYGEFSSPYIGMGNNPMTTIDIDGGRIYVTNKAGIVYEYKNGNLYDKSGNIYSGHDKFLNATRSALGKLDYATSSYVINDGKIENIGVINKLVKSDDAYSIVYKRGAHRTGGRIWIDNKATVSTPTTAGIKKSPYEITLAHELGHLYSKNNGFYNGNEWFSLNGQSSSFDENFASHWENMFRSALDLPLRTHYGISDGKPYESSKLFWPRGLFFHKPVSTIAPKPVVILQVGPLIQGEIEH
ncbi:RHS repeat protein [Psychroflexus tropicus]|uniref:RHS repeat protein n=1 Tax=Psychroflexus tropicus TaxID=197345 RepID=UPI0003A13196|nr:RHS repeat-associated core domain-containing protein [Psychroflexus tropicus]